MANRAGLQANIDFIPIQIKSSVKQILNSKSEFKKFITYTGLIKSIWVHGSASRFERNLACVLEIERLQNVKRSFVLDFYLLILTAN